MAKRAFCLFIVGLIAALAGCQAEFGPQAKYGITFYAPGVANADLGDVGLREGLAMKGYRGEVSRLGWSYSMNPVIDQTVQAFARLGGSRLARFIKQYVDEHPGREVNVVGLSAGTGVAVWGLEDLEELEDPQDLQAGTRKYRVNNVILLSSSLSSEYDVSKALRHVQGKIYCYFSPNDVVLTVAMKPFGTIDGKLLADGVGAVGLHTPKGAERVVNLMWTKELEPLGYYGGHFDSTAPLFVAEKLSPYIVKPTADTRSGTATASRPEKAPLAAHPD